MVSGGCLARFTFSFPSANGGEFSNKMEMRRD